MQLAARVIPLCVEIEKRSTPKMASDLQRRLSNLQRGEEWWMAHICNAGSRGIRDLQGGRSKGGNQGSKARKLSLSLNHHSKCSNSAKRRWNNDQVTAYSRGLLTLIRAIDYFLHLPQGREKLWSGLELVSGWQESTCVRDKTDTYLTIK